MNTEREKKIQQPLTGRQYDSVDSLLAGEAVSQEVRAMVRELDKQTVAIESLIRARREAGMTQQQMADKIGKTQGAISKLESGSDAEVTLEEIAFYATVTNQTFAVTVGKQLNHVESVKFHAFRIKDHLSALAKEAHRSEEVEQAVQAFFGEAFFNILNILSKCHDQMPNGKVGVQIRKMGKSNDPVQAAPSEVAV